MPLKEYLADLAISACESALAESNLDSDDESLRTGVFLGTSHGSNVGYVDYLMGARSETEFCLYSPSFITKSVVRSFRLRGPSETINTACSSTLVAFNSAVEYLRSGDIDAALVCGVDLFSIVSYAGFAALNGMDPEGTRPFSERRRGLSLGDGIACFLLEHRARAASRGATILCEVLSSHLRNETYHPTRPDPEALVAAELISAVLADLPETSKAPYFLAHGTGTAANDRTELAAIEKACNSAGVTDTVPITAVKYYFGHTLGSAGAMQLLAAIVAIQANSLIPNGAQSDFLQSDQCFFPIEQQPLDGRALVMNSFGFGGSLAAAAVRRYERNGV